LIIVKHAVIVFRPYQHINNWNGQFGPKLTRMAIFQFRMFEL